MEVAADGRFGLGRPCLWQRTCVTLSRTQFPLERGKVEGLKFPGVNLMIIVTQAVFPLRKTIYYFYTCLFIIVDYRSNPFLTLQNQIFRSTLTSQEQYHPSNRYDTICQAVLVGSPPCSVGSILALFHRDTTDS